MSGVHICLKFNLKYRKKIEMQKKTYVSLLILSCQLWNHGHQNLAEIGHSDEPKSLLPDSGQNQHKINASGSKFYEIRCKKIISAFPEMKIIFDSSYLISNAYIVKYT